MDDELGISAILGFDPESEPEPDETPIPDAGPGSKGSEGRIKRILGKLGSPLRRARDPIARALRRIWGSVAQAIAWLRHPDKVGSPLTLEPRGVRLLVLLILGNLILLIVLTVSLIRTSTSPLIVQSPLLIRIVATPSPVASPVPGPMPTPTLSPTPFGSGGAIAFTMRRNGNTDIYALNQTDRELLRLTHDPAEDRDPAWSPDGKFIAFSSNRAHNWDIYLLDLLSGTLIRLTHHVAFDANPSWSPDGRWIAFESYRRGNLDIYVMSTTGERLQRITSDLMPNYEPAWSPDSRAIVYTTFREGTKDVYVHLLDGQDGEEIVNITQSPDLDEDTAVWSPDGTQLAYVSGPRGNPSIQVTTFDWDTMTTDQAQTALFGTGTSPAWAPDGQSLIYTYDRGTYSHIVAANMTGWGLFHEVYSTDEPLADLDWTSVALSPRVIAQAQANAPPEEEEPPFYVELVQPTPMTGTTYSLVSLPNVSIVASEETVEIPLPSSPENEDETQDNADENGNGNENGNENGDESEERNASGNAEEEPAEIRNPGRAENENGDMTGAFLSDRVNESFNALRQRVIEKVGWDYLANLSVAQLPMDFTPYSGQSRMTWHVCGRAFGLDRGPYNEDVPRVELVREDVGNVTYWRVFVRAAEQDGSMGEPLREGVWDLTTRQEDGRAMVEGGTLKERIPSGYYVDFTTLANDYGWERVPALWRWRWFWPDVMWWRFRKTDDLTWWECVQEVFELEAIEDAFGPIPGNDDSTDRQVERPSNPR
jgi:TolB protein